MNGIHADALRKKVEELLVHCIETTTYDCDVTGVATDLTPMLRWAIDRIDTTTDRSR